MDSFLEGEQIIQNHYALITGASSGIGYSLAHKFASQKFNLLVIARDETRLVNLAKECEQKYQVKVHYLAIDLSETKFAMESIESFLQKTGISIHVLVNNAGFGIHGGFSQTHLPLEMKMVDLQISTTLALTKLVLPDMKKNRAGYILNVGSVYSLLPVPFQSVYGACKAFLYSFSAALDYELKDCGIKVSILCPGTTQTEFRIRSGAHKPTKGELSTKEKILKGMTSDKVASIGYHDMMKGKFLIIPGLSNKVIIRLANIFPQSIVTYMLVKINHIRGVHGSNT